jgi:hypothetical protein
MGCGQYRRREIDEFGRGTLANPIGTQNVILRELAY